MGAPISKVNSMLVASCTSPFGFRSISISILQQQLNRQWIWTRFVGFCDTYGPRTHPQVDVRLGRSLLWTNHRVDHVLYPSGIPLTLWSSSCWSLSRITVSRSKMPHKMYFVSSLAKCLKLCLAPRSRAGQSYITVQISLENEKFWVFIVF